MPKWRPTPRLTVSSRTGVIVSAATLVAAATTANLHGISLDLGAEWSFVGRLRRGFRTTEPLLPATRSVWLPAERHASGRSDQRYAEWLELVSAVRPTSTLVERDMALRPFGTTSNPLFRRLQEDVAGATRIALALRPGDLEGSRAHLASLTNLRRMAEEWDFEIAIDMNGMVDPRWEVEAAMQRVLPRLALVQVGSAAGGQRGSVQGRLASRAISFLLDQSYAGEISLAPDLPLVAALQSSALVDALAAEEAMIRSRHHRIFATERVASPERSQLER